MSRFVAKIRCLKKKIKSKMKNAAGCNTAKKENRTSVLQRGKKRGETAKAEMEKGTSTKSGNQPPPYSDTRREPRWGGGTGRRQEEAQG